jgi:Uma2 family endonuclease
MSSFLKDHLLGETGTGMGFVLARNPDLVCTPDIYFVTRERLHNADAAGPFNGPPDLAVEVLSPNESTGDRQTRICNYLTANTRLVWIIDPTNRSVMACYPSGYNHVFSGQDAVGGGDVLPGFSFHPDTLFN